MSKNISNDILTLKIKLIFDELIFISIGRTDMSLIKLKSSDGRVFQANRAMMKLSEFIETMINNFGEEEFSQTAIKLGCIDSNCLSMILKWAACKTDPEFTASSFISFEAQFINDNQGMIYELIEAANFLGIKDLLSVLCQSVASKLKNKTSTQICQEFGISK